MKITPEKITEVADNEVFVFGSNPNGEHDGGVAKLAVDNFGAIYGQSEGLQGKSYAVPTLDEDGDQVSIDQLRLFVGELFSFIELNPEKEFLITKIGCGIAGFSEQEIAPLFHYVKSFDNVSLPQSFRDILQSESIKGFKGFGKDLKCRDFQYELNAEFNHSGKVEACSSGFHYCEYPLDVFNYYPPTSRFAEVEGSGKIATHDDDSKIAVSTLKIGVEINISAMVKAAIKFTFDRTKWLKSNSTSGNRSASQASGYNSASQASGDRSASQASGYRSASQASGNSSASQASGDSSASQASGDNSASQASGDNSASQASGDRSASQASGYSSASQASGDSSASQASGNRSASQASGYKSASQASGDSSASKASGNNSASQNTGDYGSSEASCGGVAMSIGYQSKAKAELGGWIVIAECEKRNYETFIKEIKSFHVDGKKIKADTFYTLVGGNAVVVK